MSKPTSKQLDLYLNSLKESYNRELKNLKLDEEACLEYTKNKILNEIEMQNKHSIEKYNQHIREANIIIKGIMTRIKSVEGSDRLTEPLSDSNFTNLHRIELGFKQAYNDKLSLYSKEASTYFDELREGLYAIYKEKERALLLVDKENINENHLIIGNYPINEKYHK